MIKTKRQEMKIRFKILDEIMKKDKVKRITRFGDVEFENSNDLDKELHQYLGKTVNVIIENNSKEWVEIKNGPYVKIEPKWMDVLEEYEEKVDVWGGVSKNINIKDIVEACDKDMDDVLFLGGDLSTGLEVKDIVQSESDNCIFIASKEWWIDVDIKNKTHQFYDFSIRGHLTSIARNRSRNKYERNKLTSLLVYLRIIFEPHLIGRDFNLDMVVSDYEWETIEIRD